MPHIGDVLHVHHLITPVQQSPPYPVSHQIAAQVPDVGIPVHRRPAGVHFGHTRLQRLHLLPHAASSYYVIEAHRHPLEAESAPARPPYLRAILPQSLCELPMAPCHPLTPPPPTAPPAFCPKAPAGGGFQPPLLQPAQSPPHGPADKPPRAASYHAVCRCHSRRIASAPRCSHENIRGRLLNGYRLILVPNQTVPATAA